VILGSARRVRWTSAQALLLALGIARPAWSAQAGAPEAPPSATDAPAIGDVIPPFDVKTVEGGAEHIGFPKGSSTVLLFFLSSCPHCHQMIPLWNRAYERRPKGLTVIGVIMDQEPPGFFQAMPVAFPVVRSPGREFLNSLKVRRVPLTVRVGPGGKVEDVTQGHADPIRLGELFR